MFRLRYPQDCYFPESKEEIFPLIDNNGLVIGSATRRYCHSGVKTLHPVVHLHIVDHDNRIYLQKRSLDKDIQPGKWDTSVGGHIEFGENVSDALAREANEELGITGFKAVFLTNYVFESEIEKEMICAFKTLSAVIPRPDDKEISDGRFWTTEEIEASLSRGLFTPNFEYEFKLIGHLLR